MSKDMNKGVGKAAGRGGNHLIVSDGQHLSVSDPQFSRGLATADALMAIFGLKRVEGRVEGHPEGEAREACEAGTARTARKARKPRKRA